MQRFDAEQVKEQLIRDEGVVYEIYLDSLGFKTFGIGHLVLRSDPEYDLPVGSPVSAERVWSTFTKNFNTAVECCERLYSPDFYTWPVEVQELLINMMFNLGMSKLSQFVKMKAALLRRDWRLAAREGRDSRWYTQVTNRAERLMTRLENVE